VSNLAIKSNIIKVKNTIRMITMMLLLVMVTMMAMVMAAAVVIVLSLLLPALIAMQGGHDPLYHR